MSPEKIKSRFKRRLPLLRAVPGVLVGLFCMLLFFWVQPLAKAYTYTAAFQLVPAFLSLLSGVSLLSAAGFIIILTLTLVFGRVYCSWLCPLGLFQDFFGLFRRNSGKKKKPFVPVPFWLKTGILFITVISVLAGTFAVISLLEPFSIFGRVVSHTLKPVLISGNNALAEILNRQHVYALIPLRLQTKSAAVLALGAGYLLFLALTGVFWGRFYCAVICPAGTFLGLFARFSLKKFSIDKKICTRCGVCEYNCPTRCIDSKRYAIRADQCTACFRCFRLCPENAVLYGRREKSFRVKTGPAAAGSSAGSVTEAGGEISTSVPEKALMSRGKFLRMTLAGAGFLAGAAAVPAGSFVRRALILPDPAGEAGMSATPPGSTNLAKFVSRCTACHACVNVCPTRVLQPVIAGYGYHGLQQPRMDYTTGYCEYECMRCLDVCPTDAIRPLPRPEKKLTRIGYSIFEEPRCVVHTEHRDCGACAEVCPTHAVYMKFRGIANLEISPDIKVAGGLFFPVLARDYCIGCGSCEYACPVQKIKAIRVIPVKVHETALFPIPRETWKPPAEDETGDGGAVQEEGSGDFPF
ncbi:MAG: 4Fe-4S dicluster domain-containing protein [Spirochaetales bacterium]|nr:MAG: 4Fe-4S dicluster domain-containing protein [Spirochaetales bacterium]